MRGSRPSRPAVRTLTDVFAYARAEGVELRLDATEIQVRRPAAGRRAFVSGKKKQNTMKATVIADHQGRILWTDPLRPGRMHDATAARPAGISRCLHTFHQVQVLLDDGYLGLSRDHRGKAPTQPRKLRPGATLPFLEHNERRRHEHSSQRITVEHAPATTNAGNNSSAGPTTATGSPTPTRPSPPWHPTAASPPDKRDAQDKHGPPAITHQLVSRGKRGPRITAGSIHRASSLRRALYWAAWCTPSEMCE